MVQSFTDLTGSLSGLQLGLLAITMLGAGFLRGFVGFGSALVIIMVLSAFFGPLVAIPVSSLAAVPSGLQLLPEALRHSERSFVLPFGLATFAAVPVGTIVLVSVDPALMKIVISLFVLAMVVMLHRGWQPKPGQGRAQLIGAGIGCGLIQGAAGVGGPPVVAIALSRPGSSTVQRANVIGTVTALALATPLPLLYHGLFTREVIVMSLLALPLFYGATWLGTRAFSGGGERYFRNAALATLAVVGVITLAVAVGDYLAA